MKTFIKWFKSNWSIVITSSWLTVGLLLIVIYLCIYKNVTWEVLTGFATWILAGGVMFAALQYRQTRLSTNAQLALGLFKELRSPESRKKLGIIYHEKPESFTELDSNSTIENLTVDDIDSILDILGVIGTLVDHKILNEDLATKAFGGVTVIRCWYQFGNYIKKLRHKRGLQCGSYFEDFACRALEHFKKRKSDWIRMYHEEIDEPFDLMKKFEDEVQRKPKRLDDQLTLEEIDRAMTSGEGRNENPP